MSAPPPDRILVIGDDEAVHDDFRDALDPERRRAASRALTRVTLARGTAESAEEAKLCLDFASQGREGLACVQRALEAGQPYAIAFVDMGQPCGWNGVETAVEIRRAQPELLVVICVAFSGDSDAQMNQLLEKTEGFLLLKTPFASRDVRRLVDGFTSRSRLEREVKAAQRQLYEIGPRAGMADLATGVLHNVGNVLNSLILSFDQLSSRIHKSCAVDVSRAASLLPEDGADRSDSHTPDPKGRRLRAFFLQIGEVLKKERDASLSDIESLSANVDHIKRIIATQQGFARARGVRESLLVPELFDQALALASLDRQQIEVIREFSVLPPLLVDRHLVLQTLVNLVTNSNHATCDAATKRLTLRALPDPDQSGFILLQLTDTGVGISPDNLTRVFDWGFTTRKSGHGFGLPGCALAAKSMGGTLEVQSDGVGHGATFTLRLPAVCQTDEVAA